MVGQNSVMFKKQMKPKNGKGECGKFKEQSLYVTTLKYQINGSKIAKSDTSWQFIGYSE